MSRVRGLLLVIATLSALSGCVQRTISITTDPAGAMVWLNDREVGRTPLEVGFIYYGTYDVRLQLEGYEPMMTSGEAKAPLWETVGLDLVAEVLPLRLDSRVEWHYALEPVDDDRQALLERAGQLRSKASGTASTDKSTPQGP